MCAHLTREMASALVDGLRNTGWYGYVETWNARFGESTVAALWADGLIRRQATWTGCLELTELGERIARRLEQLDFSLATVVREPEDIVAAAEEWARIRAIVIEEE
jgi:hypothetical protein